MRAYDDIRSDLGDPLDEGERDEPLKQLLELSLCSALVGRVISEAEDVLANEILRKGLEHRLEEEAEVAWAEVHHVDEDNLYTRCSAPLKGRLEREGGHLVAAADIGVGNEDPQRLAIEQNGLELRSVEAAEVGKTPPHKGVEDVQRGEHVEDGQCEQRRDNVLCREAHDRAGPRLRIKKAKCCRWLGARLERIGEVAREVGDEQQHAEAKHHRPLL